MKRFVAVAISLSLLVLASEALAQACGNLQSDAGNYGPFDYTNATHRREKLPIVERAHFTSNVEQLQSGERGSLGGDIDYTLRKFPNHHRALRSMYQLALREGTTRPSNMRYSVGCWFQRAKEFAPDDGIIWMLHGMYLHRKGELEESIQTMQAGLERDPDNANIHYNLGLIYLDADQPEKSLSHARKAYERGFPLQGLRQRLQSAGHPLAAQE